MWLILRDFSAPSITPASDALMTDVGPPDCPTRALARDIEGCCETEDANQRSPSRIAGVRACIIGKRRNDGKRAAAVAGAKSQFAEDSFVILDKLPLAARHDAVTFGP